MKRLFALFAALVVIAGMSGSAEAAQRWDKRNRKPLDGGARIQYSDETRRLAATCRSDRSQANVNALKKQVGIDYDRYVSEQLAKLKNEKNDKKTNDKRRRIEALKRNRTRRIEQIVKRMLDPQGPDGGDRDGQKKKKRPPRD